MALATLGVVYGDIATSPLYNVPCALFLQQNGTMWWFLQTSYK